MESIENVPVAAPHSVQSANAYETSASNTIMLLSTIVTVSETKLIY